MNNSSPMEPSHLVHALGISESMLSAAIHAGFLVVIIYSALKYLKAMTSPLNDIPTVGYSGVLTSYLTAIQYTSSGPDLLQEGYDKFRGKPFKVATPARWIVVLSGRQYIQDLSGASDDIVDTAKPTIENNQADYTFGKPLLEDPYHVTTIRGPVTRNLVVKFNDINDEIEHSLEEYFSLDEGWMTVPAYETLLHLMCRASNRYFVGPELCRDPLYQDLSERLSREILDTAKVLGFFPNFLRPLASRFFTTVKATLAESREFLRPMIIERLERHAKQECESNENEKMNDILTWFIETSSQEYHRTVEDLNRRVMMINVASLHASTMVLVQAIYDLAIHPEYLEELRKEVECVVAEDGWTRGALHKLRKVDSFLKESHRMNTVSSYLMVRETLQDLTLSDGTLIPRGTHVGIASGAINKSEQYYKDAGTFKGFRFAEIREGDGEYDSIKHQMVSLSPDSVAFGHGKHACPGRFLAVTLIKATFAHILIDYDVQLEHGSMERPLDHRSGNFNIPNQKAKIMFRKRSSS